MTPALTWPGRVFVALAGNPLMTLVMATSSLGLTLISYTQAPVFLMYVCLFINGATRTFQTAASASFLPSLVDRKDLSRAVNWSATTFQLASIIGPAAAGGIILWAGHRAFPIYAINMCGQLIFCFTMTQIHTHHVVANREKMSFKTLLTGFEFVFQNKIILGIISLDMFAVLLGGATALLPVYAALILNVGPLGLGFLQDGESVDIEIQNIGKMSLKVRDPLKRSWERGVYMGVDSTNLLETRVANAVNLHLKLKGPEQDLLLTWLWHDSNLLS